MAVTVPDTTALTDRPGTTETRPVPLIATEPLTVIVPDTTVVSAPAVTVPVMTIGNAVVDWPPAIHIMPPVALMLGTAVVPARLMVPLATETVPETIALTDTPGTTETTCAPNWVTTVTLTPAWMVTD
jgi:hypothetical protein